MHFVNVLLPIFGVIFLETLLGKNLLVDIPLNQALNQQVYPLLDLSAPMVMLIPLISGRPLPLWVRFMGS